MGAVKVVHPHLARDRRFVDMLLDEARVTSQIHHPNVCSILDFGIARARGRIVQTGSYEVKGKFTYMAPEQLEGREVDRRSRNLKPRLKPKRQRQFGLPGR